MPHQGADQPRDPQDHPGYLSVATWLDIAAAQLREEGQHDAAAVLERLREDRLRTTPQHRRTAQLRWEIQMLRRGLDAALGGLRLASPSAVTANAAAAADLTRSELRSVGLYGPISQRLLAAA